MVWHVPGDAPVDVALRKERVGRNLNEKADDALARVALRKERVGRNHEQLEGEGVLQVALRKERVGRNVKYTVQPDATQRRAPQGARG